MKIKTSELSGAALDWAVEQALLTSLPHTERGLLIHQIGYGGTKKRYSTDPVQAWPIIEQIKGLVFKRWLEAKPETCCEAHIHNYDGDWIAFGPAILIAILRCYVASKLGDEVDIPGELL